MADPLELIIFDCDGVLVDSEAIAVPIDVAVCRHFGLELTEAEVIERFVGRSTSVMTTAIEEHLGHPLPADWETPFRGLYIDAFVDRLAPVDGVIEALDGIPLPICVASSSEPDLLRFKLGLVGLQERFAGCMFTASEVARGKPAPDLFLHAAAHMGARPERCAVVEDSVFGVQAARAAGMAAFAYAGGLVPARQLAGPATTVFDDMRALPDLIGTNR